MMHPLRHLPLFACAALAACGAEGDAAAGERAPAASGRVIEVRLVTDERGNYFDPADITAQRGDVLRFVLVTGVHNVHFPAERNRGAAGLPPASPLLQLPGQTVEVPVAMAPGQYSYQCDPHASLGMVGTLAVR
jgi:plastocyanin